MRIPRAVASRWNERLIVLVGLTTILSSVFVTPASAQCNGCNAPMLFGVDGTSIHLGIQSGTFTGPQSTRFSHVIGSWRTAVNTSLGYHGFDMAAGGGSNQFTVGIEPAFAGTGVYAETNVTARTVMFSPDAFAYGDDFLQSVMFHEVGHVVGFDEADNCASTADAVMSRYTSPFGAFATELTCADFTATNNGYQGPPPPPPPYDTSPIIFDLEGEAIRLSRQKTLFDMDGAGRPITISWPRAGTRTGFLVFDRNGNGIIDNGTEMFGNLSPMSWGTTGPRARDGFTLLAWFDTLEQGGNSDGWIGPEDTIFERLHFWLDSNADAVTQPNELLSMSDAGVVRISTLAKQKRRTDRWGNRFKYKGAVELMMPIGVVNAFDVFFNPATP